MMIPYYQQSAQEQLGLVQRAATGNVEPLRAALTPLVRSIAERYVEAEQIVAATQAGLEALPSAVKSYTELALARGADYKFSTYFTAWAVMAIEAFVAEEGNL